MDDDRDYRYDCNMYQDAEGFPPLPQSPKPVKSGAFSYDNKNGLRVGDISRAPLEDLALLFRKNAPSWRRAIATKPWLTAQLRLYDIGFNKSANVAELWTTLEAAVKAGKCIEGGPPSIGLVRERLAAQLVQSREDYARAVKKHKLDVEQWHKGNFSRLNNPRAEALYDLDWFFSKYFLDDKGSPAPNKTPEPIIIWDLHDRSQSLRHRVDAIPGLSAQVTGALTVIAWTPEFEKGINTAFAMIDGPDIKTDRATLEALFDPDRFIAKYFLDGLHGQPMQGKQKKPLTLSSRLAYGDGLEKLRRAAKHVPELLVQKTEKPSQGNSWGCSEGCVIVGWAKWVTTQVESWKLEIAQLEGLVVKQEKRDKEKKILAKLKPHLDYARAHLFTPSAPSAPFTVSHLVGSYLVQARLLQDEYGVEMGSMTLDVHAPTSTHGAVAAFNFGLIEGTMLLASSQESLELLREEQAVGCSDGEEEFADPEYFAASGKRKATASSKKSAKHFKRRLGGDESENPGRFYLQWAGLEAGTAKLVLDEDHERTGHFDLDKTGITARGQISYCAFFGNEKPLVFTILKVADEPRKKPDAWSSYCEGARWRRW